MNTQKILMFLICLILSFVGNSAYAAINFTLTPLKYEIEVDPGETVTRVAQIRNNGTGSVILYTGSSDFQSNGPTGVPSFVRKSELVYADQELSSWITIDRPSITLEAGETKGFSFDLNVPLNATPGGHYAAVFFKNPNNNGTTGSEIGINVDYGILLLVTVAGEIVVDIEIDDVVINNSRGGSGGGGGGGGSYGTRDDCPLGDLTGNNFDGKCIDNPFEEGTSIMDLLQGKTGTNDAGEEGTYNENGTGEGVIGEDGTDNADGTGTTGENNGDGALESFEVAFQLPINNKGNAHISPQGKIRLIGEDGKEIKGIGKEIKKNDYGAVIGEDIVDYLPINDEGGNVLPKTKRIFDTVWKGFPYKDYDDAGNIIIQYWKPGEYYTAKNLEKNNYKMPWERVSEKRNVKIVEAIVEVSYENADGELVQYNSAEEFEIEYTEQYLGLNPYILFPLGLIVLLWFLFWFILAKRKVPCVNDDCKKKLKRKQKRCPDCDTLQKEKKKGITPVVVKKKKKKDEKIKKVKKSDKKGDKKITKKKSEKKKATKKK